MAKKRSPRDKRKTRNKSSAETWDPTMLWVGAIALIALPIWMTSRNDKYHRNVYQDRHSCVCDYSPAQCTYEANYWVGPWYAAEDKFSENGQGRCYTQGGGGSMHGYLATSTLRNREYYPPTRIQMKRGGFGTTGRHAYRGG